MIAFWRLCLERAVKALSRERNMAKQTCVVFKTFRSSRPPFEQKAVHWTDVQMWGGMGKLSTALSSSLTNDERAVCREAFQLLKVNCLT